MVKNVVVRRNPSAFLLLVLAAMPGMSSAQAIRHRVGYEPVNPKLIQAVTADSVRVLGPGGRAQGNWIPLVDDIFTRDAPNWKVAFDSMRTTPTSFSPWTTIYGASSGGGPFTIAQSYKIHRVANDMVLAPGTANKLAKFVQIGVNWNPAGTAVRSGTLTLVARVYAAQSFDTTQNGPAVDDILSGIEIKKTNQAAGLLTLSANLSALAGGVALPNGTGSIVVEIGTVDGSGNFQILSGPQTATPIFGGMSSPSEVKFPGNNPSSSSDLEWEDDSDPGFVGTNKPDYIFQDFVNSKPFGSEYAELYVGFDNVAGNLQAATGLFVDDNQPTVSGKITWSDLSAPANAPKAATFEFINASTGASLGLQTVSVTSSGDYKVYDPQPTTGGNYKLFLRTPGWLRKVLLVNTTGGISLTGKNYSGLILGDCDGDNSISILDYSIISDYFDKMSTDLDWRIVGENGYRPIDADLDRDGQVTIVDYSVFSDNYDKSGDS